MGHETRLLRRPEVEAKVALARSSIYRLMRSGAFPEPLRIGPRAVRWVRIRDRCLARRASACHWRIASNVEREATHPRCSTGTTPGAARGTAVTGGSTESGNPRPEAPKRDGQRERESWTVPGRRGWWAGVDIR